MDYPRKAALVTGVLFLITYITSISALFLYLPIVDDPASIAANEGRARLGAFLEMGLIVSNVGTALALFPILKRQSEGLALGFVAARVLESAFIAVGILAMLTVVSMGQESAGNDAASLGTIPQALIALHQWTFLLGPGFTVGVGNGLVLGYLMYRTGLVPRGMAALGLLGGALIVLTGTAVMFGVIEQGGAWHNAAVGPEFIWELSLALWLTCKGFNSSRVTALVAERATNQQALAVPMAGV